MTEASENGYLVRVRAQVMCRDEGTGGWVALGGGGLADVMVGKRRHANGTEAISNTSSSSALAPTHEYYIHGKRISDNMVVLECTIKKDFQYNKVMPTFHHWVTDEKRFGLTFQTAADARAFDRGVRTAVEELLDGLGGAWPSLHAYKQHNPAPKDYDEEQNIFECLNLPCSSRSSSENSTVSRMRADARDQTPILCAIALPTQHGESMKHYEPHYEEKLGVVETDLDRYPYVHLSAVHEYTYPQVGTGGIITSEKSSPNTKPPLLKRDSGSLKKASYCGPPPLPDKKPKESNGRLRCRHCNQFYTESANRPGSCQFAPDCFQACIDCVSCIKCARCMLYHCMSDAEGEFSMHPCSCTPPDDNCTKRWIGITLLSILVPCLCCYLPLRCVRRAAAKARILGGHHAPIY